MTTTKQQDQAYGIMLQKRLIDMRMSQKDLAKKVGLDPKRISDIVRGTRALPKYRDKINEILGLDETDLLLILERGTTL